MHISPTYEFLCCPRGRQRPLIIRGGGDDDAPTLDICAGLLKFANLYAPAAHLDASALQAELNTIKGCLDATPLASFEPAIRHAAGDLWPSAAGERGGGQE